jgi:glucan phosphoethanolaminetransferase (alkaline phosphatase superfamily)
MVDVERNQSVDIKNIYETTHLNKVQDHTFILITTIIILQCLIFLVNAYLKLNLELQQVWYPTAIIFVIILVPLIKSNFK